MLSHPGPPKRPAPTPTPVVSNRPPHGWIYWGPPPVAQITLEVLPRIRLTWGPPFPKGPFPAVLFFYRSEMAFDPAVLKSFCPQKQNPARTRHRWATPPGYFPGRLRPPQVGSALEKVRWKNLLRSVKAHRSTPHHPTEPLRRRPLVGVFFLFLFLSWKAFLLPPDPCE